MELNFDGFAGASAEGKLISIVEWCKDLSGVSKRLQSLPRYLLEVPEQEERLSLR